jgi:ABC-type Na+ efflux pump permease subunit
MENKHIIIILVAIIAILAVAIGFVLLNPTTAKDPTVVKITSDNKQSEGGELSIKLTDLSENPISNEIVNVKITDKNGKVVVDDVVKTNGKGNGKLNLDLKKGKYSVSVSYGGNDNHTGDNATQKLTIKAKQATQTESSSSSSQSSQSQPAVYAYRSDGSPMYSQAEVDQYMYNKYGPVNYHIKSNGYVDMDEPGFDDKGNWVGY